MKVRPKISFDSGKRISKAEFPTLGTSSCISGESSLLSQYENSGFLPDICTERNPGPCDGGRVTEITTPSCSEIPSIKPESSARLPVPHIDRAYTGVRSTSSLLKRSNPSVEEMMFLFIKANMHLGYAHIFAKARGLEVTPILLNHQVASVDSLSGRCESIQFSN